MDQAARATRGTRGHPQREGMHTPADAVRIASEGRLADALAMIDTSLESMPDDPQWMFARGWILLEWGRVLEARRWLQRAHDLGANDPQLFLRLGLSNLWTAEPKAAEEWLRRCISGAPDDWMANFALGSALSQQGKIEEALSLFECALLSSPDNHTCLMALCDCKSSQRNWADAEAIARRIIGAAPDNARAWIKLGGALVAQDRYQEATEALERGEALGKRTGDIDESLNLARIRETRSLDDALKLYERELPHRPAVDAQLNYGYTLLTAGRLREGWLHYEFRWMQEPLLSLRLRGHKPMWNGQDLRGRTLLLRPEQGVGDVIQFIRYAPHVKALGATVLLHAWKDIGALAHGFGGVDRVIAPDEALPHFDYHVPLLDLPRIFGTDLQSIPADTPYIRVDSERIQRWKPRLDGGTVKVGIVWGGDPGHARDRYRSIRLSAFAPLFDVEGVRFFSLQKGPQFEQASTSNFPLTHVGPDLDDYADTAAVIEQLDLVICVDTSVAHLAGALGKPVWVLIATPSDWRWLDDREDSPWYPSMRLFRQKHPGNWDDVISRVSTMLSDFVAAHGVCNASTAITGRGGSRALTPVDDIVQWVKNDLTVVAETSAGIVQYWPHQRPVGVSIERYGEYLQQELDKLCRTISPGSWILEIGAGIGVHALRLSSVIGPQGHLVLYENDALRRQVLQQNVQANRLTNVTVMIGQLGETETIDDLRLEALHWIKIGDGATAAVLQGAAATLWRHRPRLWIAIRDGKALHAQAAVAADFGYRCFRIETPLFNPHNFNRRTFDVFRGEKSLALLALPEESEIDVASDDFTELHVN